VVGLEDHDRVGFEGLDPLPRVACTRRRGERVEQDARAARGDCDGGDLGLPVNARVRKSGCKGYTQPFVLRTESAPAGAPAVPAAGLRLPLSLRVTKNGRVYAVWQAMMTCGRVRIGVLDFTPSRAIKADGTFGGSQTYTIRYRGFSERYRVTFSGQFLADGARGTLRARMQFRDGKRRYVPCLSGQQTWTARP
jgi:hypothetical protein